MTNLLDRVSIVFEDEAVVVIDKPAGLVVHSDGRTEEENLCDWILANYPEIAGVGEPIETKDGKTIERPGIVHRLDRETSGVMVIARTSEAYKHLKKQFKDRLVEKEYNAFVHSRVKEKRFTIDNPIGRSSGDFRRHSVAPHTRGKTRPARTDVEVKKAISETSYLSVYPKTGRTHQIRVHLHSIHHPIICDSLYAPKKECLLGFSRQALHARRLQFNLPDGSGVATEAGLPEDFNKALEMLKNG